MLNDAMIDDDFKRALVALLFEIDPWHRCERADGSIYAEGGLAADCQHCNALLSERILSSAKTSVASAAIAR